MEHYTPYYGCELPDYTAFITLKAAEIIEIAQLTDDTYELILMVPNKETSTYVVVDSAWLEKWKVELGGWYAFSAATQEYEYIPKRYFEAHRFEPSVMEGR